MKEDTVEYRKLRIVELARDLIHPPHWALQDTNNMSEWQLQILDDLAVEARKLEVIERRVK